ncbi:MAG: ATP-dependent DNA helicase RecG [Candidatus Omnitrophota bacterium]
MRTFDPSETSVQFLKGVGPSKKKLFFQLGVETVEDLLYFFPRRYEDRTNLTSIDKVNIGEEHTISGEVMDFHGKKSWFQRKHVTEILVNDGTAKISCIWFNQPYLERYFQTGTKAVFHGKVGMYKDTLQMVAPEYEIIDDEDDGENLNLGRIVPIYPLTRGITQRYLRRTIKRALDQYANHAKDILSYELRQKYHLENLVKSLINLHFPETLQMQEQAYKRISFEEFFLFQVSVLLRRMNIVRQQGVAHKIDDSLLSEFSGSFDFKLTQAQEKVIKEIASDMKNQAPMHRLLQGDVGSGKTVVALFGCVAAKRNGFQSVFMAPTEILAQQHYEVLKGFIKKSSFKNIRLELLIGSTPEDEKEKICKKAQSGGVDLIVGTHALIQENLSFKNLSFAVVDEQHKFGVRQRALLSAKGMNPDILVMTATPIPRTLCLTLYGDLDISILNEMPPGRGITKTVLFSEEEALKAYEFARGIMRGGHQAYIIYPIVEESQKLDMKAAKIMFEEFKKKEFKDFRVGLVHGQMKKAQAQSTMEQFKKKEIDILVATTILEVGVDVPNAAVMIIEHAQRFGLSQLHQLRGRVGRGKDNATCILIANPTTADAKARLEAILSTSDGFKIAEKDLLIRGPGEFFGRHQHGLNELKIANPLTQLDILELARAEAIELTKTDPKLQHPSHMVIKALIEKRYPSYLAMAMAG